LPQLPLFPDVTSKKFDGLAYAHEGEVTSIEVSAAATNGAPMSVPPMTPQPPA
jgi:hypothetical protein